MDEERWSPITGTFPDEDRVLCKDCVYRDKTVITLAGKTTYGATKDLCDVYTGYEKKDSTGYKPYDILFLSGDCPYYKKEAVHCKGQS